MIVEPAPSNPRGLGRRALRLAGIILPAVLLVSVVTAGVLGPRPPAQTPPTDAPAAQIASPDASPDASPPVAPSPAALPTTSPDNGPFPMVVAGLTVLPVSDARLRGRSGSMSPIAVGGYLAGVRTAGACADDAGGSAPGPIEGSLLCVRIATLTAEPASTDATRSHATMSRLRVVLPPGIRIPELGGAIAPALVIVGRTLQASSSCDSFTRCGATFTADRIAWASGAVTDVVPVVDAGIDPSPSEWILHNRSQAEALATGFSGTVLVSALVHPETVALLDPAASRSLADARPAGALVWYVRALETAYGSMRYPQGDMPPRVSWVVLDDLTGTPLAWGTN